MFAGVRHTPICDNCLDVTRGKSAVDILPDCYGQHTAGIDHGAAVGQLLTTVTLVRIPAFTRDNNQNDKAAVGVYL